MYVKNIHMFSHPKPLLIGAGYRGVYRSAPDPVRCAVRHETSETARTDPAGRVQKWQCIAMHFALATQRRFTCKIGEAELFGVQCTMRTKKENQDYRSRSRSRHGPVGHGRGTAMLDMHGDGGGRDDWPRTRCSRRGSGVDCMCVPEIELLVSE